MTLVVPCQARDAGSQSHDAILRGATQGHSARVHTRCVEKNPGMIPPIEADTLRVLATAVTTRQHWK
jgi:hypothetical protein